jgi:glutamine cyclotransferase
MLFRRLAGASAAIMLLTATFSGGFAPSAGAEPAVVPVVVPEVLAEIPHDPNAYSEGLEFDGSTLYEATGLVGRSELRQLDPGTGVVLRSVALPGNYFGEGITVVGDTIWQLTYQDGVVIEWDKASLTERREIPLPGEAWGLCNLGGRFVVSDGSGTLRFYDPATWAGTGSVAVTREGREVTGLNELDCVGGQVWAALWPTDQIARIDPATGAINLVVDVSGLWQFGERSAAQVFSGIAHIDGQEFLLSGKNWPSMFRVRIDGA